MHRLIYCDIFYLQFNYQHSLATLSLCVQVPNPSAANDEGITALHNAICAGHFDIVTFLVNFGCDVNAQDSDGWTPLHCAASCNNLPMVRARVRKLNDKSVCHLPFL